MARREPQRAAISIDCVVQAAEANQHVAEIEQCGLVPRVELYGFVKRTAGRLEMPLGHRHGAKIRMGFGGLGVEL